VLGQQEDREELVALMHAQRAAIWTRNYEAWAACFVHAPYSARFGYLTGGGSFVRRGWDDIARRARAFIEEGHIPYDENNAYRTGIENLDLRIDGDMAWAVYNQRYPGYIYPDHVGPGLTDEFRIFERHDGRWKIAVMGFMDNNSGRIGSAFLVVDGEGRVLWKSQEAKQGLEDDDDLVIRGGRLRVRDSRCDRKLQAAIRWAASLDQGLNSGRGSVPVVMEAGEGLPTRVWWVKGEAGVIFVVLDGAPLTEDRLDQAAVIFGLSATQRRLAGLIADGQSMPDAARDMGISANTAKTHLQRVYDKTGVHNQAALVRILLSVGMPI
jgi:DNA-binding CsgD family transcriptional regulator